MNARIRKLRSPWQFWDTPSSHFWFCSQWGRMSINNKTNIIMFIRSKFDIDERKLVWINKQKVHIHHITKRTVWSRVTSPPTTPTSSHLQFHSSFHTPLHFHTPSTLPQLYLHFLYSPTTSPPLSHHYTFVPLNLSNPSASKWSSKFH